MKGRHMYTSRKWKRAGLIAAVAIVLAAVGCSSSGGSSPTSSSSGGAQAAKGGTVTVALPAATTYNWIFPFFSVTVESVFNVNQFQWLMYRPLYMFGGNNDSVQINYSSLPEDIATVPPPWPNVGASRPRRRRSWTRRSASWE